ncbi:MAG TPA: PAS domain S-box protein [Cyclobacteriaceae bacterium]
MIEVAEKQDLLNAIFHSTTEGLIVADDKGEITLANTSSLKMFGYEKNEIIGKKMELLVPDHIKDEHIKYREKYFQNPSSRPMGIGLDLYGKKKNGDYFPLEISLSHFRNEGNLMVVAFVVDITERKKSEEALKESKKQLEDYSELLEKKVKERTQELEHLNIGLQSQIQERKNAEAALKESQRLYKVIAKNFPNGIINVLDQNLNYIFVEGKELAKIKVSPSDLIGKPFMINMPKHRQEAINEQLKKVLEGKEVSFENFKSDRYYIIRSTPLTKHNGRINQILVVEENITKLKEAEKEVRESLNKEKELNELKSRFVAMASHEFRTPLSTILSSASIISRYQKEDQQTNRLKHINRIKSSVQNLTGILNDFLSLEKLESGKIWYEPSMFNLPEFVDEVIEEVGSILKKGQEMIYKHEGTSMVCLDKKLFKNIIINLTSNASKYSPENEDILIHSYIYNSHIQLEVKDNGIGIPEKDQKNLFERFFRAENVTNIGGTGLGLNIVKKYLELMNGSITFASELDKGTTFKINIPINEENISNRG